MRLGCVIAPFCVPAGREKQEICFSLHHVFWVVWSCWIAARRKSTGRPQRQAAGPPPSSSRRAKRWFGWCCCSIDWILRCMLFPKKCRALLCCELLACRARVAAVLAPVLPPWRAWFNVVWRQYLCHKVFFSRVEPRQYAHGETQLMAVQISLLMGRRKGRKLIFYTDEQRVHSIRIESGTGNGDGELQRTMLELLKQHDGFETSNKFRIVCFIVRRSSCCSGMPTTSVGYLLPEALC